jgi:hypothetical protein
VGDRKKVIIEKKLTNRLKREVDKTNKFYEERIKLTHKFIAVILRLGIADYWKESYWTTSIPRKIMEEQERVIDKMMCRKARSYRYGRKIHTWRENDEQIRKERDKRDRKIESQIREMFYRGLTEARPNSQSST